MKKCILLFLLAALLLAGCSQPTQSPPLPQNSAGGSEQELLQESSAAQPPSREEPPSQAQAESEMESSSLPEPEGSSSSGAESAVLPGNAKFLDEVEIDVFAAINDRRCAAGVSAVSWNDDLAAAARIRAAELFCNGYTDHIRPNGDRWLTVLQKEIPLNYSAAGEILASIQTQHNIYKIENSEYWVGQWENSTSHYNCMVNGSYTHAGTAVVYAYDRSADLYHGYACTIFACWD